MEPERWAEIERLYHLALERSEDARAAFLADACHADPSLRSEVESLLAQGENTFIASSSRAVGAWIHPTDLPAGAAPALSIDSAPPNIAALLPLWAQLILVIAVLRTTLAVVLYLSIDHTDWEGAALPYWVYAALSSTMTAVGIALVIANRRDLRAAWLGGMFVLLGGPLATPLLQDVWWALLVRPEAFSPAFVWRFTTVFPTELGFGAGRVVRAAATTAAVTGLALFVAQLTALWARSTPAVALLARDLHWTVIMAMSVAAFPVLAWRAATATGEARRRATVFARGLLLGLMPISLEVLAEELSPAYLVFAHRPEVEPFIATLIFGALATAPFVTAYSVLYDGVVEMRLVVRSAVRYALARYTIAGAALVPFVALALFLFQHREEPIVALLAGLRPLTLGACVAIGLVALRRRHHWIDRLDRRFFREAYDARDVLARIVNHTPPTSYDELARRVCAEIDSALHADTAVFLVDDRRAALRHVGDRLAPLGVKATLAELALGHSRPMDIDLMNAASALSRLPRDEQEWLRQGPFSLLVGIRRGGGAVAGLLALTAKQSGLPYSAGDCRLLVTMAATIGLALDSLRLASTPDSAVPAARECLGCGRICPPDTGGCACGGPLIDAAVPYMLRGVFRFEARIGAGGMGVVYRAVDVTLGRDVAVKALPQVTDAGVERLRREARAMAAVTHPNLAVIHGIEVWQDTPFLVEEYVAGGTLAQRLAAGRPTVTDALALTITLADVLQQLHAGGVIHCDIKPSNIGFTQHNVVKLLDFGLARAFRDLGAEASQSVTVGSLHSVANGRRGVFGTPQFMSPEAIRGEAPTPQVDLWALSVVLFQALTGRAPFEGPDTASIFAGILAGRPPDPRAARPELPATFSTLFADLFAPDPGQRPQTGAALAAALRPFKLDNSR